MREQGSEAWPMNRTIGTGDAARCRVTVRTEPERDEERRRARRPIYQVTSVTALMYGIGPIDRRNDWGDAPWKPRSHDGAMTQP